MSGMHDEFRAAIDEFFAEMGQATRDVLAREIVRPGGLGRLLRLLAIPDPGHADDQYTALLNHMRRHGEATLLRALQEDRAKHSTADLRAKWGQEPLASSPERPRAQPTLTRVRAELPDLKPMPAPKRDTPADTHVESRPAPPAAPPIPAKSLPGRPLAPPADREAGKHLADWDGTERRVSSDRRSGSDRRDKIEVTFKNKRYGRDRRSKQERRSNWPPKDQKDS